VTVDQPVGRVHIRRLRLRDYRSVARCDIPLQAGVTFLVGPNGAGKSNVLDGLRFVADALNRGLGEAVNERGGFAEIVHQRVPRADGLTVEIVFDSPPASGTYRVTLGAASYPYGVVDEQCKFRDAAGAVHDFSVGGGSVVSSDPELPLPDPDRLYLASAANLPVFRPVYDALVTMSFYNLNPAVMRGIAKPDPRTLLARSGSNIATAVQHLSQHDPAAKEVVEQYLRVIVPGIVSVDAEQLGSRPDLDLQFKLAAPGELQHFSSEAMSDGTLRALGVLVAGFQPGQRSLRSLVGIEEPESAVHPSAGAVLRDAVQEAAERRQIVLTTHSPDLLDDAEIDPDSVLAVDAVDGRTVVGPPDSAGLSSLHDRLFTAGELLRVNQLTPAAQQE
jgi:predicted ATPase